MRDEYDFSNARYFHPRAADARRKERRWWMWQARFAAVMLVFASITAISCMVSHRPVFAAINSVAVVLLASNLRMAIREARKYR